MLRECIYGECAQEQHLRRILTLTLTHTITAYSVSGNVVRVRIVICATRQKPRRKRVYPTPWVLRRPSNHGEIMLHPDLPLFRNFLYRISEFCAPLQVISSEALIAARNAPNGLTLFLNGVCMLRECMYGECAHAQHVRRTLTLTLTSILTHTITAYSVSGNVVRVRILICASTQKPCRKGVNPPNVVRRADSVRIRWGT